MKNYFKKSKLMFTEDEINQVRDIDASMYGFILIDFYKEDPRNQMIYCVANNKYRAVNWVRNNEVSTDLRYAVVSVANL